MQAFILKCRPRARFHFGSIALDNNSWLNTAGEWLPSDTLFSAIANNMADMYPAEIDRLIQYFIDGDVAVSSGFYLLNTGEKEIYFLPKPAHYALSVRSNFKAFKRVNFVSKTVWENGWLFEEKWPDDCVLLQNGTVVAAKSDLPESFDLKNAHKIALFKAGDYPRVRVHTPEQDEGFYYLTATSIADNRQILPGSNVDMYFLFDTANGFDQNPDCKKILAAIRMLPDRGVGGERTAGCGLYEHDSEFQDFQMQMTDSGNYCTVSLVLPGNETEFKRFERYQVQTRGGRWYGGDGGATRKPKQFDYVRMLSEGAFLRGTAQGRVKSIGETDGHDVLRYGRAFYLPTHEPKSN